VHNVPPGHNGAPNEFHSRGTVADDNIIPFRKRPPSEGEMDAYLQFTRNWSSQLRQLLFPEHFKQERNAGEDCER
jgi:hypothetical protein